MACSSLAFKYACCFFLLVVLVLLVPGLLAPSFYTNVKTTEKEAQLISQDFNHQVVSEIERTTHLLSPANSSAANLARILNSSLDGGNLSISFSTIETSVAPGLFQALSTVPHLSQVAYIGSNGLFFSYYISGNQTSAVYSNSSRVANASLTSFSGWYTRPVNRNNGKLYGEATSFRSLFTMNSTSLLEEALNSTDGHASLGTGFTQDLLFFNTVGLDGKGAISLGFSLESLTHFFSSIEIHGGNLYLATKDGRVLAAGIASHSVSFEFLNANGTQKGHVGNVTCEANNSKLEGSVLNIGESNYMIYCSPLDILGVKLEYD
ncbi:histidine kinase CKI1-like [Diospyros lotus]|uniref:histidine kinase CKI1-like n=1 Tax=Diospyros lotus TaxID=55363 RepID=UPI00224FD143|nr:histidine kinase CKI1-like [Diospyros lotus]